MDKMKRSIITIVIAGGLLFLFGFFSYKALSTVPSEFDSIIYHIPLAKSILNGQIIHPDRLLFPNSAFPASTELLLAIMMVFHVPLNLFNIIAWVLLGILTYRLGQLFNLKDNTLIFSFSILTLPPLVRLLLTQTVDIWVAVFFVWTWYLLLRPEKKKAYFLQLGFIAGLLVGAKFSGPLFLVSLILIYGKGLLKHISIWRVFIFLIPFSLLGLSWYIRNAIVFSNPFFPAPLLWMQGSSSFSPAISFSHFRMITSIKNGFLYMRDAFLSEYLFWPFIVILGLCFTSRSHRIRRVFNEEILLFTLGFFGIIIFLVIPGNEYNYDNYVSEIRYSVPMIVPFILLFFVHIRNMSISSCIYLFTLLNLIALGTLFFMGGYHPKIIVIGGILVFLFMTLPYVKSSLYKISS